MAVALVVGGFATFGPGARTQEPTEQGFAAADLIAADGTSVGTARFTPTDGGVRVEVDVDGLPPGEHGTHVHERGECASGPDPADGAMVPFGAAGGHFDPMATRNHDRPEVPGSVGHAGGLPNLVVGEDGTGTMSFETDDLSSRRWPRGSTRRRRPWPPDRDDADCTTAPRRGSCDGDSRSDHTFEATPTSAPQTITSSTH